MGARLLEPPPRVDPRPQSRRPELTPIEEPDEPTIRVYQSRILQKLDRAPNLASRVESQEHIRVEMLNAIVRASHRQQLAYAPTVPFQPFATTMPLPGARPPLPPRANVHVRTSGPRAQSGTRRRPFRRRSNAPLFAIFVAFAIFLGLAAQYGRHMTRSQVRTHATKLAHVHAAKLTRRH